MRFCLKEGQMVTYFEKIEKNDLSQLIWTRLYMHIIFQCLLVSQCCLCLAT